ncbi:MAG: hypothetical protein GC202_12780 [Alphaproteobacteria bacterium]|nr:hypothetical protein [Alphaproteobacteria bacterium]
MMEGALRGVIREALTVAASTGLPGEHHFYLTFRTNDAGVDIPPRLRQRHPDEMTIVLQHQFWGLEVGEEKFSVTLSFDRVHERLTIPYAAITAFVDPSVQFGLQFPSAGPAAATSAEAPKAPAKAETPETPPAEPAEPADPSGRVVALDAFRKK